MTLACTGVSSSPAPVSGTAATSDIRFTTGAENYGSSGENSYSKAANQFTFGNFADNKSVTGEVTFGTVYVALTGRDNLVVDSTHLPVYTLTVSANYTAA